MRTKGFVRNPSAPLGPLRGPEFLWPAFPGCRFAQPRATFFDPFGVLFSHPTAKETKRAALRACEAPRQWLANPRLPGLRFKKVHARRPCTRSGSISAFEPSAFRPKRHDLVVNRPARRIRGAAEEALSPEDVIGLPAASLY